MSDAARQLEIARLQEDISGLEANLTVGNYFQVNKEIEDKKRQLAEIEMKRYE